MQYIKCLIDVFIYYELLASLVVDDSSLSLVDNSSQFLVDNDSLCFLYDNYLCLVCSVFLSEWKWSVSVASDT